MESVLSDSMFELSTTYMSRLADQNTLVSRKYLSTEIRFLYLLHSCRAASD